VTSPKKPTNRQQYIGTATKKDVATKRLGASGWQRTSYIRVDDAVKINEVYYRKVMLLQQRLGNQLSYQ